MPDLAHERRSLRLVGRNYAIAGAYYVTICTHQRQLLFEDPELASCLAEEWHALPVRFPSVALDEFILMPNHIHFIIWLTNDDPSGVPARGTPTCCGLGFLRLWPS